MKSIKRDTRAVYSNTPTGLLISEILTATRKKFKEEKLLK